ncbi:MAG: hypothetical protein HOP15_01770 [Planctomycetes bacterium]|nr:hypothetical protein [Planctomycetota bacterium]
MHRPVLALALVAACAGLMLFPGAVAALEFVRARVLAGELWRLWSGHLVHATPRLAFVDLCVLALLGAWWERRSRVVFLAILGTSALFASLALLALTSFERYTGSSALGSGLFVATALALALEQRGGLRVLGAVLLALFAAKCVFEASGAQGALFAALPAGTLVAAAAHAAGGAGGALVVLLRQRRA